MVSQDSNQYPGSKMAFLPSFLNKHGGWTTILDANNHILTKRVKLVNQPKRNGGFRTSREKQSENEHFHHWNISRIMGSFLEKARFSVRFFVSNDALIMIQRNFLWNSKRFTDRWIRSAQLFRKTGNTYIPEN